MALSNSALLRPQSILQQLLEEINFQRAKEMRQMLKDDGGFVMLQGTTYWTDLFVRHFLFQVETEQSIDSDDLLFFVRKKHVKGSSRHMPKFETDVDVYRKDSRKLPIGDPDVDWEETVYLNLIIHQFNYTLTLAICTRTSPKELQVLRRHSQRVYASPSRRKMDTKGDGEEMTYPHICFMVDNFDEVFCDIMVRDGEMVCVELVANDRDGTVQGVIFLGSIRYDALKRVYDARQSSISSKLAQRMTFGLFSGAGPQTRCEFVRMKGPQGKGHAEMAVTKPKGSGVETPTSEPGFCMTDMYDEWDEDPDDFLNYRHQRRLSDPSANLNNYNRFGWKTKPTPANDQTTKAMSQNEGLDSLASEVSEIEAGDLKDDGLRSASPNKTSVKLNRHSASMVTTTTTAAAVATITPPPSPPPSPSPSPPTTTAKTPTCCNCFGPLRNQWGDDDAISNQMSEIYCRTCDEDDHEVVHIPKNRYDSPAILTNVTKRTIQRNKSRGRAIQPKVHSQTKMPNITAIINVDKKVHEEIIENNKNNSEDFELGDDIVISSDRMFDDSNSSTSKATRNMIDTNEMIRVVRGKEELPVSSEVQAEPIQQLCQSFNTQSNNKLDDHKTNEMNSKIQLPDKVICTHDHPLILHDNKMNSNESAESKAEHSQTQINNVTDDCNTNNNNNNNYNNQSMTVSTSILEKQSILKRMHRMYSTLPKMKKVSTVQAETTNCCPYSIPSRTTVDGTTIYYMCDISKNVIKELDDGVSNPLWASRGFTQTFHFWKEHRRQQSVPLNAFLTYITLPWWSIAKDLLDHRETPILTF
ncbi:uncharacterized protein LOC129576001 isoform X1 [Sitodiplosis mosellana]|uniref:uncharacterized protein LOC129576001 isoform X1 n=1 Tax=Sitodiplosis mosellana TaxID=263140 RepID=UPI00244496B7|nr:uncharacterized protein LOC129576001 isoform X1 [Sitodiplosis mosellana]XP_055316298.1 uncharacterized protein LOC129576001 isoform X1 [Sitodiplosis mosellana]XP_055316299.1 uncharacterized protein LOC129576001 isoform X1 [Sitodiplosis mosellana]XP_055316300.1 uncharacterized protein LOC129576001 isoform X1 [Sitodiplosis mosellana]